MLVGQRETLHGAAKGEKRADVARTSPGDVPMLEFRAVGKVFEETRRAARVAVLSNVNLSVRRGEFVSIVGPSGCGKSTILRILSGLVLASSGEIRIDGKPADGTPPGVGFMFQSDLLLPWATVAENISVGLELGGCPHEARAARLQELLQMVGLAKFASFHPSALSGGMRQRAALARTLAYQPSIFLMDEPFGALDAQTKILLGREFLRIWSTYQCTVLFVTHDIAEAITMSDRVVVMSARPGRMVAQFDVPLPRPRDFVKTHSSKAFSALYEQIWTALMQGGAVPQAAG